MADITFPKRLPAAVPGTKPAGRSREDDPRIQRSQNALRQALLELLDELPIEHITITEIARRAGIGYATFFRHYQTKDDLLGQVAAHEISDLLALSVPVLMQANSFESCRAICSYVDHHRALWRALLTGGAGGMVRAEFLRQALNLIPSGLREGHPVPIEVSTLFSSAGTLEVLAWWLDDQAPLAIDNMARILDNLITIPKGC